MKDDAAPTQIRPVSTGVIPPTLVHTTDIIVSPEFRENVQDDSKVVLKLNLDQQGKAEDIQVIQSVNPTLDREVVDAVRQFRWRPAKLDNQPVPTDVTLKVVVQR
jgi:protein TonB